MWPSPPYHAADGSDPRFVLRQVSNNTFTLEAAFVYRSGGQSEVAVNDRTLPGTDLASIPWFASWFVGRHGRHTPAALVHDCLVHGARQRRDYAGRVEADRVFRRALDELGIPPVRSRVMWAAVTFGTRWHGGLVGRAGLLLWLVSALAGTAAFVYGAVTLQPPIVVGAAAAPVLGGLLWGRQYLAGLIASYALLFIGVPAVACILGYGVYWVVEEAVRLLRAALRHGRRRELPGPTPFDEVFTVTGDRAARDRPAASATPSTTVPQAG